MRSILVKRENYCHSMQHRPIPLHNIENANASQKGGEQFKWVPAKGAKDPGRPGGTHRLCQGSRGLAPLHAEPLMTRQRDHQLSTCLRLSTLFCEEARVLLAYPQHLVRKRSHVCREDMWETAKSSELPLTAPCPKAGNSYSSLCNSFFCHLGSNLSLALSTKHLLSACL